MLPEAKLKAHALHPLHIRDGKVRTMALPTKAGSLVFLLEYGSVKANSITSDTLVTGGLQRVTVCIVPTTVIFISTEYLFTETFSVRLTVMVFVA